jgi:ABC-type lipoprotein release transport system permease subunit
MKSRGLFKGTFKMAWRNIWRNRRRTLVTVGAMTLALLILVLYTGLVEGYLQGMERNILDLEIGDIQIHAGDYLDRPSIYTLIEDPDSFLNQLDESGYRASARLLGGGLVAAGESSAGALLRGVNIDRDAQVSEINEHVVQGSWLDPDDPEGVVLGRRLAQTLVVKPGDELVILSQATDGSMANDLFTVRGVLQSVSDGTDRAGIFLTAQAFRDFFVLPEGAHQIIVRRSEQVQLEAVEGDVRDLASSDLDVKTWRELVPTLASLLDSTRSIITVMFFVIYLVIAILILNAMLMAVFERVREFGVLKAIGVSPERVLTLILIESALQTGLAILVGLTLSIPGLWYLTTVGINVGRMGGMSLMGIAMNPIWHAVVTPATFMGPVVMLVVMVFIAVLYPALKAARITPVQAMRHQ